MMLRVIRIVFKYLFLKLSIWVSFTNNVLLVVDFENEVEKKNDGLCIN